MYGENLRVHLLAEVDRADAARDGVNDEHRAAADHHDVLLASRLAVSARRRAYSGEIDEERSGADHASCAHGEVR